MRVAVLYIARGLTGGMTSVDAFLETYRAHPAGCPHTLYLLAKGWDGVAGYDALSSRASEIGACMLNLPDDGFDWGAYMRAARLVDEDWICCLNTHSRILHDGWLAALANAAQMPTVGAAGCTGSWGTIAPSVLVWRKMMAEIWETRRISTAALDSGKLSVSMLPNLSKIMKFPPFPNPHLRSNAFLIRRADILDFGERRAIPRTKVDAWVLESGRQSLTRFLKKKGVVSVVVDKKGASYTEQYWVDSNTFRVPGQISLLISDNQSRSYETLSNRQRRMLELITWGRGLSRREFDSSRFCQLAV